MQRLLMGLVRLKLVALGLKLVVLLVLGLKPTAPLAWELKPTVPLGLRALLEPVLLALRALPALKVPR